LNEYAEAVKALRRAIELNPDSHDAHVNLYRALCRLKQYEEAMAAARRTVQLKPDDKKTHTWLSTLLLRMRKFEEAETAWRQGARDSTEMSLNLLGFILRGQGKYVESLEAFRRGQEASTSAWPTWIDRMPSLKRSVEFDQKWPGKSAQKRPAILWIDKVRGAERLVQLDQKLPAILSGEARPADARECADLAGVCLFKKLPVTSTRLIMDAFAAQPNLADDVQGDYRYNAACAAALAGCGLGKDATQLGEADRARLRQHALTWLRAHLVSGYIFASRHGAWDSIGTELWGWELDFHLAGVRGNALANLPEAERAAWAKLWADVENSLARARAPRHPAILDEEPDSPYGVFVGNFWSR
jgi:tetratricopeptide (TPR) repeat protein